LAESVFAIILQLEKLSMKKIILLSVLIVSICISNTNAQSIDTYIKFLTNDTNADAAVGIAPTPEGNYIISCMTGGQWAFYCADGWIIKINPSGDTLWTRRVGGGGLDMLGNIIVDNNKYITVGFKYVFLSERQGWLLEYDSAGNKLVDRTYGGSLDDGLGDIISAGDGGYLSLGSTKSFGTDSTEDVWLVKFNSSFDTLWTKHYDLGVITGDSSHEDNANGIIPFGTNKYLMAANTCKLCDGTDGIAWYTVIDSTGNLIGSPHIFNEGYKNKFVGGIRPTSDGGAIITGATSIIDDVYYNNPPLPPFRSEDMWIVKLNSAADTEWTKIYGQYGIYDGGWSIFQTPDGGYFMSAYSQINCTPNYNFDNVWLMRLNNIGDTIQVCRWGGPQNDDLLCIIPATDGGAIGVGCYNSNSMPPAPIPGDCDVLVMKTDCNLIADVPGITDNENVFNVFPNPASGEINIELTSGNEGNISVELFDLIGKKISEENYYTSVNCQQTLKFMLPEIQDGIYLIQLRTENSAKTLPLEISRK
jgi:hypothetical protein